MVSFQIQAPPTNFGTTEPYPGCREAVRRAFVLKGFSEASANTMLESLSSSTLRQYDITLKKWWIFSKSNNFSPFEATPQKLTSFFQTLLDSTKATFSSFNSHRAAVSLITQSTIGEDTSIKRYMKGLFNLRPPKPKYDVTWDPQVVLSHLETVPGNDLPSLSKKLVTILALATGQRLQTLHLIQCSNISTSPTGMKIIIPDRIKTTGPGRFQPFLDLPYFENPALCPSKLIEKYLGMTKGLRSEEWDNLFITTTKPFKPASKDSLARWVKDTLEASGVDVTLFTAHSTRHASSSAALRRGVSFDTIRKSAGWSASLSTFARFYNRPLADTGGEPSFLNAVLTNSSG